MSYETARMLGVTGIALGVCELLFPRQIEKTCLGISNGQNTGILRVQGVREIAQGIDILSHRDPTPGVWARVAGDVLDTVLLGAAGMKTRKPVNFAATAASVLAIGIADVLCASRLSSR
jgi:hypothetical protein